ncbi:MAG TPA: NlpC/P60 family protein [Desulfosporosinus sp.]|nr:NlpC/P60 family protein [Desulfosporosinus sp.]
MKKFIILTLSVFLGISILVPSSVLPASAAVSSSSQTLIDQKSDAIIATATNLIGKATYQRYVYKPTYPYQFGCSGFIYYVFLQNGINLDTRDTQLQAQLGVSVTKDQLKKGDLVFFDSSPNDAYPVTHDAIYIGDNKIIHMADSKNNVVISDLSEKAYYRDYYKMARRVIPSYMPPANPTKADAIVGLADSLIGKAHFGSPYNESTLTFNSPGFVYYAYKKSGIDLKTKNISEQAKLGTYVPKSQLKKGDLVFFSNSSSAGKVALVGIYAGNQQLIVAAGSSLGVINAFMLTSYYQSNYVTARRIL